METARESVAAATVEVRQRGVLMSTGTHLATTSMGQVHKKFMSVILREDTKPLMYHGHTGDVLPRPSCLTNID